MKTLADWLASDVEDVRSRPLGWLSENYFFRDPARPTFTDSAFFFAPADGVVLYALKVRPEEAILEIKGETYSLTRAMRDPLYDRESFVIGIFMTFFDVHVNRMPFAGRLSYRELETVATRNQPMLPMEKDLVERLQVTPSAAEYLFHNQRVLNRVFAPALGQCYYILQIADYDVDSILPFRLKQNMPFAQNQRFSQIRYGSQVDLIVPLSKRFEFTLLVEPGMHVEAGLDPVLAIREIPRGAVSHSD